MEASITVKDGNMITEPQRHLDAHQLRLVAATAYCDPRSVLRVLRREAIRSSVSQRVERAMADLRRRGKLPRGDAGGDLSSASRGCSTRAASGSVRSPSRRRGSAGPKS